MKKKKKKKALLQITFERILIISLLAFMYISLNINGPLKATVVILVMLSILLFHQKRVDYLYHKKLEKLFEKIPNKRKEEIKKEYKINEY